MNRRAHLLALASGLLAPIASPCANAQQPKVWRVGVLVSGNAAALSAFVANLRASFAELGYTEPNNIVFLARAASGAIDQLPQLADELVRARVDVMFTGGSEATRAAKQVTGTVPIVFSGPSYPVEEGLVTSFARPGGNVTGITIAMSDTVSKHVQLLREVVPALRQVGVVWSPSNAGHTLALRDMQRIGTEIGLSIASLPMAAADDIQSVVPLIDRARPQALVVQPAQSLLPERYEPLGVLATNLRIPSISIAKSLTRAGLLMSYGADFGDAPRRLAGYAQRIFRGAKPADLPIERPTRFDLVINAKAAKAMNLAVPRTLLLRADEVIQ